MVSHDASDAAIALAESAGLVLDESQRFTLRCWMGERCDGSWAAFEAAHIMGRQNGKGAELEARQLAGLFVLGEELQLHTAHEFKTANEHFLRMAALVEGSSDLRRKVARIRYANGEQGIELRSGARLKFMARSGGSGRGFAGASTVYFDEAMYLAASMIGAALPTMSAHWNPQVVYTGSAGFETSSQMHALRRRALSGDGGRLAYVEHTAEVVELDADGAVVSSRDLIDPDDREAWFAANPTLGDRISVEFVEAERRSMPVPEFMRERLGVWEPEPLVERGQRVISEADWLACVAEVEPGQPVGFGLDVTPDRSTAAIGVVDAAGHCGVIEHRPGRGLGWVAERVAELRVKCPDARWVVDARSAANGLVDAEALKASEMAQACGGFFDAVVETAEAKRNGTGVGRVSFRRQSALEAAVGAAVTRPLGDAWAWDRRKSSDDVSPLVAVTLAFHAHRTAAPARHEFAFVL